MNTTATAAETKPDPWAWWKNACAGNATPIDANSPEQGFYRIKYKGEKIWRPVAYWWSGGELRCMVDGKRIDADDAISLWTWAAGNPITEDVYKLVIGGGQWPDVDQTVAAQVKPNREVVGGNNPPEDEADQLKVDIENAAKAVESYKEINDDETLARAQSARARLLELKGFAVKKHKAAKDEFLEGGRKIDRKWFPLRDAAEAAAELIRAAMKAWENKKAAAAREKQQQLEDEQRRQAEQEQSEADAAIADGTPPSAMAPPIAPEAPPTPPAPPAPIKGGYGRAASVQIVKVPVIVDQDKVYAVFRDRQEVKDVLMKLVKASVKGGYEVDGVNIEEERDIR